MVYSLAILPPTLPRQQNDNNGTGTGSGFNARDVAVGSNADASSGKRGVAGSQQPAASQSQVSPQKEEEMLKLFEQRKKDLEKLLDIYEQRLEEAKYLAGDNFTIADLSHLPNADRLVSDPRSRRMFESRKNVSRWWHDVSSRDTWQYVKSLQRPPSTSTDASAKNDQQQQHLPGSTDGHGVKSHQQVQNERHF
jgi:glutathione S-transferase